MDLRANIRYTPIGKCFFRICAAIRFKPLFYLFVLGVSKGLFVKIVPYVPPDNEE